MRSSGSTICLTAPSRHLLLQKTATIRAQAIKSDDILAGGADRKMPQLKARQRAPAAAWLHRSGGGGEGDGEP